MRPVGMKFQFARWGLTLSPSEGSVPAIAAARAAVKDSTSSMKQIQITGHDPTKLVGNARTYQDHNEAVFLFNHFHNASEKALNELPGL